MIHSDQQVDAKGLACPMPIIKTKKAMQEVKEGQVLEIQATDKGSTADIKAWSTAVGHQYIGSIEQENVLRHYIRKCNPQKSAQQEKKFIHTVTNEEAILKDGVIIDVREAAEYAFGHIPAAISIPLGELENHLEKLDMNQEYFVICRTGTRSDLAAQQLQQAGFKKIYNVLPGMSTYTGELKKEVI
ncbi:MAG: sulfurtransferase TusA family protein [Kurthia sp.]|nr:sulfurtransferase TusA family protein [Candidatus Kurthia equi]